MASIVRTSCGAGGAPPVAMVRPWRSCPSAAEEACMPVSTVGAAHMCVTPCSAMRP